MSQPTLMAEPRTVVGKKVKNLRKEGLVPGVIYGPALEKTISVTVDERTLTRFYYINGHSTLLKLSCDGTDHQVIIREVQLDPVKKNPLHVDFFAPNLLKDIHASVPLMLHDEPDGPGNFTHLLYEVVVNGLPTLVPNRLPVDCSVLKVEGDVIRVADLSLPEGVTFVTNAEEIIAMLSAKPAEIEEVVEEAAVAGVETADAEKPEQPAESESSE